MKTNQHSRDFHISWLVVFPVTSWHNKATGDLALLAPFFGINRRERTDPRPTGHSWLFRALNMCFIVLPVWILALFSPEKELVMTLHFQSRWEQKSQTHKPLTPAPFILQAKQRDAAL